MRFTFAASEPSSSRFGTSSLPEKSPAEISASLASMRWIGPISDHERRRPRPSASVTLTAPTATKRFRDELYALRLAAISAERLCRWRAARVGLTRSRSRSAAVFAVTRNGRAVIARDVVRVEPPHLLNVRDDAR